MNRLMHFAGLPLVGVIAVVTAALASLCAVIVGVALLAAPSSAAPDPAVVDAGMERPDLDPAALNLGNSDAGGYMSMISRTVSLRD